MQDSEIDGIEEVDGCLPTEKLEAWWERYFAKPLADGSAPVETLAISAILQDEDRFDGLWWYDRYEPEGLSAPRGVIFPGQLREWRRDRT